MLAKFSVKKPYTVVVVIALVVVLGVVSLNRMTTDLLPSMNLPYAIVMTMYPGASPQEVEEGVTKPIESAMATTSNIKHISSTSSENYSMGEPGSDCWRVSGIGGEPNHSQAESRYASDYGSGGGCRRDGSGRNQPVCRG